MKNDNHIILKSGRILNACIGVLTSEIVSLLFSVSTFLVLGSLFFAIVAIIFIVILLKYCDVFEKKVYVLKENNYKGSDLYAAAFRNTLVELGHIQSSRSAQPANGNAPRDQDVIKESRRRLELYCSLFLVSILLSVGFAICGGINKKNMEERRYNSVSDSISRLNTTIRDANNERIKEYFLIQELKASIDTLDQFRQEQKNALLLQDKRMAE